MYSIVKSKRKYIEFQNVSNTSAAADQMWLVTSVQM